jgi:tetratricopeptide (TPR) repeat protein/transcriptional regulator with XRE-family HTH domain
MFGELVAVYRHRLGLTQEELARRAGLSVRTVRGLESGRVRVPRQVSVRLLADALGLQGQERDVFVRQARAGTKRPLEGVPAVESRLALAQLPLAVPGFAGRSAQLAALDAVAALAVQSRPVTVVISAVSGTAGVGKTALAIHWAHRVRDRFPDGQLYVNLRGFDPGGAVMAAAEAVRRFLDALGVPAERIPADLDAQAGLYRSLLAGRRMLVVLDNARDAEQVRPLLPGAAGCLVVVTSRSELSGLVAGAGAHPVSLDLLTGPEAWQLLAARLGPERLAAEPDPVQEIIQWCARLPLALAIVAARAAAHPDFPLAALAAELREPAERLDALADADPGSDLRAVFSWSYRALSPPAARLFRLLGLHPGPDISAAAAASLAGLAPAQLRPLVAELTAAHLIVEHLPRRYTLHDLLRAYAEEQACHGEGADDRREAIQRLLDHYVHTAYAADRLLDPLRESIVLVEPRPGVTPERLTDNSHARAWFTAEHAVLLAALDHAAGTGFHTHAWQLAWCLVDFLDWQGHWHDYVATQRTALTAAERLGDPAAQALTHRHLARAHARLGHIDEAHSQLRHALKLYDQLGHQVGQAATQMSLALIVERQRRYTEALHHAQLALDLYRAAGKQRGQAIALNACGWYQAHLSDYSQALASCQQALSLFQELGDHTQEAAVLDSVGYAHHHLGNHREAAACYRRAVTLLRELGDRYSEAGTLTHLGDAHHAAGDTTAARDAWREALTILDELGHPDADDVRAKLRDLASQRRVSSANSPQETG